MKVTDKIEPKLLRDKAYNSVKQELESIEKQMSDAAGRGELKIVVDKLTPAAREYFKAKGFEVKILVTPSEPATHEKWSIAW